MPRLRAKKDANHNAIARALRAVGCTVFETHQLGAGYPDLTVGRAGVTYLLEVKAAGGSLTPAEEAFVATWRGHVAIVRTIDEALRAVGVEGGGQ